MQNAIETSDKLDFNKVWLMFQETDKKFIETYKQFQEAKELIQRTSIENEKARIEIEKKYREDMKKLEKQSQKRINKLEELFTGQWGKLVETLVEGKLVALLKERNIDIYETYTRVESEKKDIEIDIIVANGKDVVVVEVKTTLNPIKVDEFINKLKRFQSVFHRFKTENTYGTVAYLKDDGKASIYAQKLGLFVIRAVGDSARIINPKEFKPISW